MKTFSWFNVGCLGQKRFFVLVLSFCASVGPQTAFADGTFLQRVWQSDQGLPHDSVQALTQTRDHYIWVGTRRGVARFDGSRFILLEIPGATKENISSLLEDKNGALWIGTAKGTALLKDGRIQKFKATDGFPQDDVRTLYESKDGSIWIGRSGGLSRFHNGTFRNFTKEDGLPHNVVRAICEDAEGNLWIGTDGGLCLFKDGKFPIPEMAKEVGNFVRCMQEDREKDLWVGTQTGLFRKAKNGKWERFDKVGHGLADDFINTIYCDAAGQMWIGTYGGLNRFVNGKFVTEFTSEGTAYDLVNAILEDREKSFWVGSKEGLTRLRARPLAAITKQQGLTYNNVMCVFEDSNKTIWCGTWGGGLFQLKSERMRAIDERLGSNRVLSLCEATDRTLWAGTDYGEGIFRMQQGQVVHYGDESGLERVAIRVIYEDRDRNIWIGSRLLYSFHDGRFVSYSAKDGLVGETVRVIYQTKDGTIWIGTNGGLSRHNNGKFIAVPGFSGGPVVGLREDSENNLWIGTGGNGLFRLKNGKLTAYTTREGLFNDEVLEILEDDFGYLWMTCLKGIFRIEKSAFDQLDRKEIDFLPCTSYGKEDGMVSVICGNVSKPAAWKAKDGRLWFATTKGLIVADPAFRPNASPPPVRIEEVIADKKSMGCDETTKLMAAANVIEIPPGRGQLEFRYTALSFQGAEKNRFKFKLEGVDPDWVDAGTRRIAYYNNLAPGTYMFSVLGCNSSGIWSETPAHVKVVLLPHIWQTWWFKSLVVLVGLSAVAAGARYVTRKRMALKLERLQRQYAVERERARIAKDIHDDLGASLTRIIFLGELAETDVAKPESATNYVQRIVGTARDTVRSLDEIVWAVTPRRDTLNSFVEYVAHYADEFLEKTELRCRLDLPDSVPEIPVSSEVRHSLFLVVKESLNNAVKHAKATEICIGMKLDNEKLTVEIHDNGQGLPLPLQTNVGRRQGNGLDNMRKRIEGLGGFLQIKSAPGQGTTVWFEIKLSHVAMAKI